MTKVAKIDTNTVVAEGVQYQIGTNDGKQFEHCIFIGYGSIFNKPVMVFDMKGKPLSINPSYHTFILEE